MSSAQKRLYRSASNKILGGVCGGIGEYFNIDPVIIRLIWILFTLMYGFGLLLYIIAWIIIPPSPSPGEPSAPASPAAQPPEPATDGRAQKVLILLGSLLLAAGVLSLLGVGEAIRSFARQLFSIPFVFIWLGILVIVVALLSRR